jgi:hypothetical protein
MHVPLGKVSRLNRIFTRHYWQGANSKITGLLIAHTRRRAPEGRQLRNTRRRPSGMLVMAAKSACQPGREGLK